jgi:hypothetical protein
MTRVASRILLVATLGALPAGCTLLYPFDDLMGDPPVDHADASGDAGDAGDASDAPAAKADSSG